jgi:peroxiredoxin
MTETDLKFGIPDIALPKAGGGFVNPSDFAGHQLIIVFCPTEPSAAARELSEYGAQASELCDNDAWIVGICDDEAESSVAAKESCFSVAADQERAAWEAFRSLSGHRRELQRDKGAVFLFGRGGSLQRAWAGAGHASEVTRELKQRM